MFSRKSKTKGNLVLLFIGIIVLNFVFIHNSVAYELSNPKIEKVYDIFAEKVKKKYSSDEELDFFKKLDKALESILKRKNLSSAKLSLLKDLQYLNKKEIAKKSLKEQIYKDFTISKNNKQEFEDKLKENNNKQIIDGYTITKEFTNVSYDKNDIFLENGIWYAYNFITYKFFATKKISASDLSYNNIDPKTDLLFLKEDGELGFVEKAMYEKVRLISDDIINDTTNKYNLLVEIKDDKKSLTENTDELFKKLKEKSIELTKGLNEKEKIETIYNYILENIQYTENLDFSTSETLEKKRIFSGIETFRNKDGVCEGYTKLFMYMLNFAGVGDIEVIRGFVIDAEDFPEIGHAWVKIGNTYYDPTFDDPIGLKKTKQSEEYKFFNLPEDLFYTNRFTYDDTPESLKTESMSYRKSFIKDKLSKLVNKYENEKFLLLDPFILRQKYKIPLDSDINLTNFGKILPLYEVRNFQFTENGALRNITKLKFFTIKEETLEALIEQLNYNLDGYYFFKWYTEDGGYEYRLGYNLELK